MNISRRNNSQKFSSEPKHRKSVRIKLFEREQKNTTTLIQDFPSLAFGIHQILQIQKRIKQNRYLDKFNPEKNFDLFWINNVGIGFESLFQRISKILANENPYFIVLEEVLDWKRIRKSAIRLRRNGSLFGIITSYTVFFYSYLLMISSTIVNSNFFDTFSFFCTICYCFILNPKINKRVSIQPDYLVTLFVFEQLIRILTFGMKARNRVGVIERKFLMVERFWIAFDMTLLLSKIAFMKFKDFKHLDLLYFRLVHAVRYLKIKVIKEMLLGVLVAIFSLGETLFTVIFIGLAFAITGLQMFSGWLHYNCMSLNTGKFSNRFCGNALCPEGFVCAKKLANPDYGFTSFDDIFESLLQVFRIVTVSQWGQLKNQIQQTFSNYVWIYFLFLVFLGNFFLINLMLVVIKIKYTETQHKLAEERHQNENEPVARCFRLKPLKDAGAMNEMKNYIIKVNLDSTSRKKSGAYHKEYIDYTIIRKNIRKDRVNRHRQTLLLNYQQMKDIRIGREGLISKILDLFDCLKRGFAKDSINIEVEDLEKVVRCDKAYISTSEDDVMEETRKKARNEAEGNHKIMHPVLDYSVVITKIYKVRNPNFLKNASDIELSAILGERKIWTLGDKEFEFKKSKYTIPLKKTKLTLVKKKKTPLRGKNVKSGLNELMMLGLTKNIRMQTKRHTAKNVIASTITNNDTTDKQKNSSSKISFRADSNIGSSSLIKTLDMNNNGNEPSVIKIDTIIEEDEEDDEESEQKKYRLISKLIQEDIINVETREMIMDTSKKIRDIQAFDQQEQKLIKRIWSGKNVIRELNFFRMRSILHDLSKLNKSKVYRLREKIARVVESKLFKSIVLLLILFNTIILCIENILEEETVRRWLKLLSFLFLGEIVLKVVSLGIKDFLRAWKNSLDLLIIFYMAIDNFLVIFIADIFKLEAFRYFRCLSVLRAIDLLLYLEFMEIIFLVFSQTYKSILSLSAILITMIFSYALLGMEMFKLEDNQNIVEPSFQRFPSACMSVFQIITLDNWYEVYFYYCQMTNQHIGIVIYMVSLVFFGNIILLNLLIAIMLDGFEFVSILDLDDLKQDDAYNLDPRAGSFHVQAVIQSNLRRYSIQQHRRTSFKKMTENMKKMSMFDGEYRNSSMMMRSLIYQYSMSDLKASGIKEKASLFIFTKENLLRRFSYTLMQSEHFHQIMLANIFLMTFKLALDTFVSIENPEKALVTSIFILNIVINSVFIMEAVIKIVVFGFVSDSGAYLRNPFNFIDFICIIGFSLDFLFYDRQYFKIINLLRIIRPLRILYFYSHTKGVIISLMESFSQILQLIVLVFLVWLIFALLGVTLYRNRLGYCGDSLAYNQNRQECHGDWNNPFRNFDHVANALLSLLAISTFDNWSSVYVSAMNSDEQFSGPIKYKSETSAIFFFTGFILIGTYLFIGVLAGVMFANFTLSQKRVNFSYLTDEQTRWLEIQKAILKIEPLEYEIPRSGFKKRVSDFTSGETYHLLKRAAIFLDLIQQTLLYDDANPSYLFAINMLSYLVSTAFLIDLAFRVYLYGSHGIKGSFWNKLEFVLTVSHCFYNTIQLFWINDFGGDFITKRFLKAASFLKIISLFRLFREVKAVRNFFINLISSLPVFFGMGFLLLINFFTFSIIGCFFFQNVRKGIMVDEYLNFKNIFYGSITLFRCATSDNWSTIMLDIMETPCEQDICFREWTPIYFVIFMVFTYFILLNLFILLIFQQFELFYKSPMNSVTMQSYISRFRFSWEKFQNKDAKKFMPSDKLIDFLWSLDVPLGFPKSATQFQIGKAILGMNIRCIKDGHVYFNELLFILLKKTFKRYIHYSNSKNVQRLMRHHEITTYKSLNNKILTDMLAMKTGGLFEEKKNIYLDFTKSMFRTANPLANRLKILLMIKYWIRYAENPKKFELTRSQSYEDPDRRSETPKVTSNRVEGIDFKADPDVGDTFFKSSSLVKKPAARVNSKNVTFVVQEEKGNRMSSCEDDISQDLLKKSLFEDTQAAFTNDENISYDKLMSEELATLQNKDAEEKSKWPQFPFAPFNNSVKTRTSIN